MARIVVMGGDGIGPEVVDAARAVLDRVAGRLGLDLVYDHHLLHGACWDVHGVWVLDETVEAARWADAVLVGAEGGPKWDSMGLSGPLQERSGLSRLRYDLDLYANLRPAKPFPALFDETPFKPEVVRDVDLVILRELCGGVYFGLPKEIQALDDGTRRGVDTQVYTETEIERIVRYGFELARSRRGRLCSVEKSNVMESGVLWREVATRLHADFPDVDLVHQLADNTAMQLVRDPAQFDVVVADNLLADLLSDQAGMVCGSLGMLPSASFGDPLPDGHRPAIYEPVHGAAPDIAGRDLANPIGAILSVAMMLRHSLTCPEGADLVEAALGDALDAGHRTRDLLRGGPLPGQAVVGCSGMRDAVLCAIDDRLAAATEFNGGS